MLCYTKDSYYEYNTYTLQNEKTLQLTNPNKQCQKPFHHHTVCHIKLPPFRLRLKTPAERDDDNQLFYVKQITTISTALS